MPTPDHITPDDLMTQLAAAHPEFRPAAFVFVSIALETAVAALPSRGHVSGRAVAECLRDLAIARYGCLAQCVLADWGIRSTLDIGRVVFALVEAEVLAKRAEDTLDDFRDLYDFDAAFTRDYPWRVPDELRPTPAAA